VHISRFCAWAVERRIRHRVNPCFGQHPQRVPLSGGSMICASTSCRNTSSPWSPGRSRPGRTHGTAPPTGGPCTTRDPAARRGHPGGQAQVELALPGREPLPRISVERLQLPVIMGRAEMLYAARLAPGGPDDLDRDRSRCSLHRSGIRHQTRLRAPASAQKSPISARNPAAHKAALSEPSVVDNSGAREDLTLWGRVGGRRTGRMCRLPHENRLPMP